MNAYLYVSLGAKQTQTAQFCEWYLGLEKGMGKLNKLVGS